MTEAKQMTAEEALNEMEDVASVPGHWYAWIRSRTAIIRSELRSLREKVDSFQAQYDHCIDHYTSINRELSLENARLKQKQQKQEDK